MNDTINDNEVNFNYIRVPCNLCGMLHCSCFQGSFYPIVPYAPITTWTKVHQCPVCEGVGQIKAKKENPKAKTNKWVQCPTCSGARVLYT